LSASPAFFPVANEIGLTVDSAADSTAFFATDKGLFRELRKANAFAHLIGGLVFVFLNRLFRWFLVRCLSFSISV